MVDFAKLSLICFSHYSAFIETNLTSGWTLPLNMYVYCDVRTSEALHSYQGIRTHLSVPQCQLLSLSTFGPNSLRLSHEHSTYECVWNGLSASSQYLRVMVIPLPCNSVTTVLAKLEEIFQKMLGEVLKTQMQAENFQLQKK